MKRKKATGVCCYSRPDAERRVTIHFVDLGLKPVGESDHPLMRGPRERYLALPAYVRELLNSIEGAQGGMYSDMPRTLDAFRAETKRWSYLDWVVPGIATLQIAMQVTWFVQGIRYDLLSPGALLSRIAILMLPMCASTAWYFVERQRMIRLFSEKLEDSGLIELMASGPAAINKVFDAYPAPISRLIRLFGREARDTRSAARLLSANLDWFLQPRRFLLRPEWLGLMLGCAAFALQMIGLQQIRMGPGRLSQALFSGIALLMAAYPLGYIGAMRSRLAQRALSAYLRERFEECGSAHSAADPKAAEARNGVEEPREKAAAEFADRSMLDIERRARKAEVE